jgi:hypothetical protein
MGRPAPLAQSAEHIHGKDGVGGSIPPGGSTKAPTSGNAGRFSSPLDARPHGRYRSVVGEERCARHLGADPAWWAPTLAGLVPVLLARVGDVLVLAPNGRLRSRRTAAGLLGETEVDRWSPPLLGLGLSCGALGWLMGPG